MNEHGLRPLPEYEPSARPHTDTVPGGLVAFLRARLDEDEQTAREAAVWWGDSDEPREAPHWRPVPCGHIWNDQDGSIADELADRHAAHIARRDPARALAEVEAKRRIIDACVEVIGDHDLSGYGEFGVLGDDPDALAVTLAVETLRALALPFADHTDYRPEWRL